MTKSDVESSVAYIRAQWLEVPLERRLALTRALRVALDGLEPGAAPIPKAPPAPTMSRMSAAALHEQLAKARDERARQTTRRSSR
jgi:hypothetical protein